MNANLLRAALYTTERKNALVTLVFVALVFQTTLANAQFTANVNAESVATVSWGAQIDRGLASADGDPLTVGSLVRIGSFSLSDDQIRAAQFDYSLLNASFIEYDTAIIGENMGNLAGFWAKGSSQDSDSLLLSGKKIFLWAFNAPSSGGASQQGIFASANTDWVFPSSSAAPPACTTLIDLSQVQADEVVVGALATNGSFYNLAPIPEPAASAVVMTGLCLVGVAALRYNRSRAPARSGRL